MDNEIFDFDKAPIEPLGNFDVNVMEWVKILSRFDNFLFFKYRNSNDSRSLKDKNRFFSLVKSMVGDENYEMIISKYDENRYQNAYVKDSYMFEKLVKETLVHNKDKNILMFNFINYLAFNCNYKLITKREDLKKRIMTYNPDDWSINKIFGRLRHEDAVIDVVNDLFRQLKIVDVKIMEDKKGSITCEDVEYLQTNFAGHINKMDDSKIVKNAIQNISGAYRSIANVNGRVRLFSDDYLTEKDELLINLVLNTTPKTTLIGTRYNNHQYVKKPV